MFRGLLRPGQGFKVYEVLQKQGGKTASGRPTTKKTVVKRDEIMGIISQASQKEIEQWKQAGHPISHKIVQRGNIHKARTGEILRPKGEERYFFIQGTHDPAELGHFTTYYVEEREDLQ